MKISRAFGLCGLLILLQVTTGLGQAFPPATAYNGLLQDTVMAIPGTEHSTSIRIYLPAGYGTSKKTYPVVYVPGMRNFDSSGNWLLITCIDSLARRNRPELILVGFDLLPGAAAAETVRASMTTEQEEQNRLFLTKTLKPFIDRQYRTQSSPSSTLLAGADSGALIAYHLLLSQPDVFGKAALFSPPFLLLPAAEGDAPSGHNGKFFFYWVSQDLPEEMSNLHYIDQHLGNAAATMIFLAEEAAGENNLASWKQWLPEAINWLLADGFNYVMGK